MAQDTPKDACARQIDESLKKVFQQALHEDIPDRFLDLLDRLKSQETTGAGASNDDGAQ